MSVKDVDSELETYEGDHELKRGLWFESREYWIKSAQGEYDNVGYKQCYAWWFKMCNAKSKN